MRTQTLISSIRKIEQFRKLATRKKKKRDRVGSLPEPQPKQREFLETEADIALYGGAAGSGKSLALLLDFARPELINNPRYKAIIFRRTYPEIRNEGGLWDESINWYTAIAGDPNQSRLTWKFPQGSSIRFAHLQHEKTVYSWKGGQVVRVGFDELTSFTRKQFFYLLTRMRSPYGIKPKLRATCNPDAESWLADFVSWYINPQGYPYPERSGVLRWFIVIAEEVIWGNSKEELLKKYPNCKPKSFTFISAKITDNPILLENDPDYLGNLEAQDPVERARLLDGNWRVKRSEARLFKSEYIDVGKAGKWQAPDPNKRYLWGVDPNFGGSDFFDAQCWDISKYPYSLVYEYREQNLGVSGCISAIAAKMRLYKPILVGVETNSGGKIVAERLIEKLPDVLIKSVVTSQLSKITNTDRIAIALENGDVIYPDDWSGIDEMRAFSKQSRCAITGHDDAIMAWASAFAYLDEALELWQKFRKERIQAIVGQSLVDGQNW